MNRNNPTDKEALDLWELLDKANPEDIQLVNQCSDLKFTSEEVWQVIKSLKGKNSSGFDLISNKMIKNLPHNYLNILTKQYNALFSLSYWDKNWKQARTICFNKVDSPAPTKQQLRPISLLPVMGKIYERLFLFRFQNWLNNFGILPWQKSGARAKQCTVSRVNHLLEQTYTSLLYNTFTLVVFIDFLQVFDILWQEERTMKIVLNGQLSNNIILQRGAPQGSVFGPIAYIVTHYDLRQIFKVPENNHLYVDDPGCVFIPNIYKKIQTSTSRNPRYNQSRSNKAATICNRMTSTSKQQKNGVRNFYQGCQESNTKYQFRWYSTSAKEKF
ncbi:unnamed protein product [Rotaria socialis]|uniref:Reverse transcriptase domain-containing protein n=2 Tax=Rotaria socialis TaxID=392032 RepID=A0A817VP63_9BILA|nr:unnamed protein product [Rotaria socialis]CAF4378946.1 unnamed protein product [Rotaria socialis]